MKTPSPHRYLCLKAANYGDDRNAAGHRQPGNKLGHTHSPRIGNLPCMTRRTRWHSSQPRLENTDCDIHH